MNTTPRVSRDGVTNNNNNNNNNHFCDSYFVNLIIAIDALPQWGVKIFLL